MMRRHVLMESHDDLPVAWIACKIGVFERVGIVIVEFLSTIGTPPIPRITISSVSDRVVLALIGCQRRLIPLHRWILKQRREATPVVFRIRWKTAELNQRWIHVNQIHYTITLRIRRRDAGNVHDERHACRFLPQSRFSIVHLLAQVPPMVTPDHDNGVVRVLALFK